MPCHPRHFARILRPARTYAIATVLTAWGILAAGPMVNANDRLDSFATPLPAKPESWDGALVGPRREGIEDAHAPSIEPVAVATATALREAVRAAEPGTIIEIQPGSYDFSGTKIEIDRPGLPHRPIVLRAPNLGSVRLRFSLLEGFHVLAPYWTFENFVIEGTCKDDSYCEHAFHIVGNAVGVVIQNNWVVDFNAAVKVNGKDGRYPDDGIIRHNAFMNSRPRDTGRPVTTLDLVSVSRWRVQKNVITDFAKAGGNHTSYGAFFKGAGEDNIFEQNLVRCEWRHSGLYRIGFSFGDGGTGRRFCRDGLCRVEHSRGIARNNVIMNCPNRAGIYLNKSAETLIHNNALIATGGITLTGEDTDALILNNILDGEIFARDGATFSAARNRTSLPHSTSSETANRSIYVDPWGGDLRLKDRQAVVGRGLPVEGEWLDLCNQPSKDVSPDIGPIQYGAEGNCVPRLW